jgi:hypothetical protein
MKEIIITVQDLLKYMNQIQYENFIDDIRKRTESKAPIWIIAQILEEKDYL